MSCWVPKARLVVLNRKRAYRWTICLLTWLGYLGLLRPNLVFAIQLAKMPHKATKKPYPMRLSGYVTVSISCTSQKQKRKRSWSLCSMKKFTYRGRIKSLILLPCAVTRSTYLDSWRSPRDYKMMLSICDQHEDENIEMRADHLLELFANAFPDALCRFKEEQAKHRRVLELCSLQPWTDNLASKVRIERQYLVALVQLQAAAITVEGCREGWTCVGWSIGKEEPERRLPRLARIVQCFCSEGRAVRIFDCFEWTCCLRAWSYIIRSNFDDIGYCSIRIEEMWKGKRSMQHQLLLTEKPYLHWV